MGDPAGIGPEVTAEGVAATGLSLPLSPVGVELDHFIDAVINGTPVETGLEDGRRSLLIADAATRSAQQRQPVGGAEAPAGVNFICNR